MNNVALASSNELTAELFGTTPNHYSLFQIATTTVSSASPFEVADTVLWTSGFTEMLTKSTSLMTFHVAPNKVSPQDKVWQEVEQFLREWDEVDATTNLSDEWLDNLRADWDRRLDELYGSGSW